MRKRGRQRRPRGILSWWKDGKVGLGPVCSQGRSLVWVGGPQSPGLVAEKNPLKTSLMSGQGQRSRNLVGSRKQCDHPNVQKHERLKSGGSPYARVIQTPESAHRDTLDLDNSESAISWERGRRHHSFTGTHWGCEPQWSHVWGTVLEQTGISQAACNNVRSYSLISSLFNLFCQKTPPRSILCLQAFVE